MTNADKRSVATDALETLGTIIDEHQKRDAIHLAVEPVVAGEKLYPGQEIGFISDANGDCPVNTVATMADKRFGVEKVVGIVDPFIKKATIYPGERFWLVVFPRQITSLRHVWTHPDFGESELKDVESAKSSAKTTSQVWIENYANGLGLTGERLIEAAKEHLDSGEYFVRGGDFEGTSIPEIFWDHFEEVTGKIVPDYDRENFLSCSC